MKLSQRMHDVIWGPWVDDPIAKENERHEWLKEVCQLEAVLEAVQAFKDTCWGFDITDKNLREALNTWGNVLVAIEALGGE